MRGRPSVALAVCALVMASVDVLVLTNPGEAAPFADGGFEAPVIGPSPGYSAPIGVGQSIGEWTVTVGDVELVSTYWSAAEGAQSLDLNGTTPGTLCQSFDTTAGDLYRVSFQMSHNWGTSSATLDLQVGDAPVAGFSHTTANSAADMKWEPHSRDFTAAAARTKGCFASTGPSGTNGPALDDVRVTLIAPATTTTSTLR